MILAAYFLGVIVGGFAGYHIGKRHMYIKTKAYIERAEKILDDLQRRTENLTREHEENVTRLNDSIRKFIKPRD